MNYRIILLVICSALYIGAVEAQDSTNPNDRDGSAEQAEAREDAYRKRMELEGSRDRDTFTNTTYTTQAKQEKIDKLPRESQDNIRDQLTSVIIDNPQWEPFDALREYPYEPTEAAQGDPGLRDREVEAWAEQMEKYHQREASAYAANRPSLPASDAQQANARPGGEQGQEQSEQGESASDGGQSGDNQGEWGQQDLRGTNSSGTASSYEPYRSQQSDTTDEISTAGVSESALDFLRASRQPGSSGAGQAAESVEVTEQQVAFGQAKESAGDEAENGAENELASAQQSSQDSHKPSATEFIIPGTIAIEDLDRLEGMAEPQGDASDQP